MGLNQTEVNRNARCRTRGTQRGSFTCSPRTAMVLIGRVFWGNPVSIRFFFGGGEPKGHPRHFVGFHSSLPGNLPVLVPLLKNKFFIFPSWFYKESIMFVSFGGAKIEKAVIGPGVLAKPPTSQQSQPHTPTLPLK